MCIRDRPKIVCVVVVPFIVLVCVFPVDWVSGAIMLVMYPVIVFYMELIGATAKAAASLQHEEYQRLSNHFIDSMRGIDTLKLFGRGRRHGQLIYEVSERFREATVKTLRIATLSGSVLDLISTLSLAAVALSLIHICRTSSILPPMTTKGSHPSARNPDGKRTSGSFPKRMLLRRRSKRNRMRARRRERARTGRARSPSRP